MADSKGNQSVKDLISADTVKRRFEEVIGAKAPAFLASVLNATRTNKALAECDPMTVLSSAMVAATLDLPIDGSLGFAAIVPYRNKGRMEAQFQIMTKGFVQLAIRSGQYQTIHVGPVYADEYHGTNILTGEVDIRSVPGGGIRAKCDESLAVGYVCYFRLLNGYECTRYWTVAELHAHGKRYSKSYDNDYGMWETNFPAMGSKTVLKNTISKWGPLSTDMKMAIRTDQSVIKSLSADPDIEYVDRAEEPEPEPRPAEDVIAPAKDAPATSSPQSSTLADIKTALIDYMEDEAQPQKIRDDIDKALKAAPNDPIILGAMLNKVKSTRA